MGKSNEKLIGLSETDITPDFTTTLDGYSRIHRECEGVHDRLHAKTLVIEADDCAVAILSVPVVSVKADSTSAIRNNASELTGIPPKNILVHATHTHSAPVVESEYKSFLEEKCVQSIKTAYDNRFQGRIGFGRTTVDECGKNRRYLDYGGLPVDPEIVVMRIEDETGDVRGVVYNYACHGTVLGADNKLISEDWPYYANKKIKNGKGDAITPIFLQGASGDINPGYSAGLSAVGAFIPLRTYEEAQRLGRKVGKAVVETIHSMITNNRFSLRSTTSYVDLPTRDSYPISLEEARKKLKKAEQKVRKLEKMKDQVSQKRLERAKVDVFFASLVVKGAENFYGGKWAKTVKAELQAIFIDNNIITTFPGEVFFEAGIAVKKNTPADYTMIASLSNAHEARGYIPTREAYEEGDYEVFESYYREDAAELLVEASTKLVNSK